MHHDILALDIAGTPVRWIGAETAAGYYASGKIAWEMGDAPIHLRGGFNRQGVQSGLAIAPIVAVRGGHGSRDFTLRNRARQLQVPRLSRRLLFARDRHLCAYCGAVRTFHDLSMDHIVPTSRGGRDTWSNLVTACQPCNQRKANRTPDEARMPLLYVPYAPNRYEDIIVRGRRVVADQMAFLLAGVPRHSRLLA